MQLSQPKPFSGHVVFPMGYLLIFIYVVLRAIFLSFTHDESLSYQILLGNTTWIHTANNHWLNTFLMGISRSLFGSKEIALRLPNVLSFALYLIAIYHLLKSSDDPWFIFLGSSLLLFNPFLIDFFSLARGYGLSLGFLMLSIFYGLKAISSLTSTKNYFYFSMLSILFILLASLANFSVINMVIALLLIFSFMTIKRYYALISLQRILFFTGIIVAGTILLVEIKHLFWLKNHDQLYQGASSLLGTVDSFVLDTLYLINYPKWLLIIIRFLIILSFPAGLIILKLKKDPSGKFLFITILLTLIITGLFLEHILFGTKYPYGRTALFLIPLYGLYIYFFTLHLVKNFHLGKRILIPVIFLVNGPLLGMFIFTMNLKYTYTWRYDAHTKDIMNIVRKVSLKSKSQVTISNNWLFEPTINYYIQSRQMKVKPTDRKGPNTHTEFIYTFENFQRPRGYKVYVHYEDIGTILYQKKLRLFP